MHIDDRELKGTHALLACACVDARSQAEQLWVGEGQTLYLSNEDLMFEWTTGVATRSKNLDSLCLDKIVR